jgi:hypothetical protein
MQEMTDPALSLERARATWQQHGRSDKWIQQRMTGQETRNKLTDYWAEHDVKKGEEYDAPIIRIGFPIRRFRYNAVFTGISLSAPQGRVGHRFPDAAGNSRPPRPHRGNPVRKAQARRLAMRRLRAKPRGISGSSGQTRGRVAANGSLRLAQSDIFLLTLLLSTHASCWLHLNWKPHPCGFYGDSKRECRCSTRQIENYRQRISGPLLDRIDIHCEVPLVDFRELSSNTNTGESSATIRKRVVAARGIQLERFKKSSNSTNSSMGSRQVRQHCQLSAESNGYLEHAMEEMNFSARAHDRILKVARTLADLAGSMEIRPNDILEAIQFRSLDRKLFS